MAKLRYRLTNDTLFKMLFVEYPDLLKSLIAELLNLSFESIVEFAVTNPEIPPMTPNDKFCRLDIHMTVNGQRVDLEIQVSDEHDYPERSLYYWARAYSSALQESMEYQQLPRVVSVSILAFKLFDCKEYHSEFQPLEVTRHAPLTDRQSLHYFELPKLPKAVGAEDRQRLWLAFFKAKTKEDLAKIEAMGVPEMTQAVEAFREITARPEFRELERVREKARRDEVSALANARRTGQQEERQKWKIVVAGKDAALAGKDAALADKDAALADKDAQLAELRAQLKQRG